MGVQVVRLPPVVCARQGRAGNVCGEDAQGAAEAGVVGLHEPDEAGAEHGVGGGNEGLAERVHGVEVLLDLDGEVRRGRGDEVRVCVDAAEEEVVVEGHAGQVEGVGACGIAGELDDERLDVLALERPSLCHEVQLVDNVLLVLGEGEGEAAVGEQAGDAIGDELVVSVERRDCVQAAGDGGRLSSLWCRC